jgi:hypothetical protein
MPSPWPHDMKTPLPDVTLIGVDCLDIARLQRTADICERHFSFGAVKLLSSLPSDDARVRRISPIRSHAQYSEFCISKMHVHVDTDFALVIQYDGFILNPAAWTDDFLAYDYIGAPWPNFPNRRVGNGGFSLRSKRLLEWTARNHETIGGKLHPEDIWICRHAHHALEKSGFRFASEQIASRFSKEGSEYSVVWNGEFGFHGLDITDLTHWLAAHPEYATQFAGTANDFVEIRRTYPDKDKTVHTLGFHEAQLRAYTLLSKEKSYEVRLSEECPRGTILPGHTVICRRIEVPLAVVGIPSFARAVRQVEHFASKTALMKKHPALRITGQGEPPIWKPFLARIFGNLVWPDRKPYTLIWFMH